MNQFRIVGTDECIVFDLYAKNIPEPLAGSSSIFLDAEGEIALNHPPVSMANGKRSSANGIKVQQ